MKIIKIYFAIFIVLVFSTMLMNDCKPLRNFTNVPQTWAGDSKIKSVLPESNVIENSKLYMVAKEKTPILIKSDLFVIPQVSIIEAGALQIHADVIVIPVIH